MGVQKHLYLCRPNPDYGITAKRHRFTEDYFRQMGRYGRGDRTKVPVASINVRAATRSLTPPQPMTVLVRYTPRVVDLSQQDRYGIIACRIMAVCVLLFRTRR